MLKKNILLVAITYSTVLGIISLTSVKGIPDLGVSFADKIYHFLAYAMLSYLWFAVLFYRFTINRLKAISYAAFISIVFGIIIEVLQGGITASRISDVYDGIANTLGVLITVIVLLMNKKCRLKVDKHLLF